jgi:hypothetical protein
LDKKMRELRLLAAEVGRAHGPAVTVHQGVQLGEEQKGGTPAAVLERHLGRGTPPQLREDVQRYQEMGVSAIICNFAAASVPELWRAMETFAAEVMPHFPEAG